VQTFAQCVIFVYQGVVMFMTMHHTMQNAIQAIQAIQSVLARLKRMSRLIEDSAENLRFAREQKSQEAYDLRGF
jgi:ABC-type uncharacterized transport system fused permease/ATPase subunit